MPPPGTGVLSFGLVAIPVRIHTATKSENVSFHLLHEKCGSRVRNQYHCPVCNVVGERGDLVRGFQHAKDQYLARQIGGPSLSVGRLFCLRPGLFHFQ